MGKLYKAMSWLACESPFTFLNYFYDVPEDPEDAITIGLVIFSYGPTLAFAGIAAYGRQAGLENWPWMAAFSVTLMLLMAIPHTVVYTNKKIMNRKHKNQ